MTGDQAPDVATQRRPFRLPSTVAPQDVEAEQAVLGALMLDPNAALDVQPILDAEDFYVEKHRHIYQAALALSDRGEPIDPITLRAQMERAGTLSRSGGLDYITELSMVTPTAASVRHYAAIVVEHAQRRGLLAAGYSVAAMALDDSISAQDATERAEQAVLGVRARRGNAEARHVGPVLTETWAHLQTLVGGQRFVTGVATGFSELDELTQGWQPGELTLLAARPSVGKTSFALNVARTAAVGGTPAAVFSLEMTTEVLMLRQLCAEAHVDGHLLRTGHADAAALGRVEHAMRRLSDMPLWIDDTAALTIGALRTRARRLKARQGVGLVVVDHLQLVRPQRRAESRVQEVAEISAGLKAMAKELAVPVLALSQLSRESERRTNRRPQLSDLRDSGSLEQDADIVLFLYREGMHNPEVDKAVTELIVAKNRNGPVRDINLVFIAEQTAFREPYRGDSPPRPRVVRDITESASTAAWGEAGETAMDQTVHDCRVNVISRTSLVSLAGVLSACRPPVPSCTALTAGIESFPQGLNQA